MTIICKTMINPTSYRELMKYTCKINNRIRKRRKLFYVLSILPIIWGGYELYLLFRTRVVYAADIFFVAIIFLFAFYVLWLAKYGMVLYACREGVKQHFRNFTVSEYSIDYQFTDEGIDMKIIDNTTFLPWTAVVDWQEEDSYFYYEIRGNYQCIEKDGFEKGDLEKFRILIKDKLGVG